MHKIAFNNLSKKYIKSWIFQEVTGHVSANEVLLIKGGNGSGKSTLLKMLAGIETPTEGAIEYTINSETIPREKIYQYLSICAPYQSLYEELTLSEHIKLLNGFNKGIAHSTKEFIALLEYPEKRLLGKRIEQFSSGMKQRIKLAFTLLGNSPIIFLDEPSSNLDAQGVRWYKNLLSTHTQNKLVLIASNDVERDAKPTENAINLSH